MNESKTPPCAELELGVTQYAWGELAGELRPVVETHLNQCAACRELVSFVGELTESARRDAGRSESPDDPHPDPSLIVDLEADELDDEQARKVSVHLLRCKSCRDAYLLLRSLSNDHFEERILANEAAQSSWGELIERLKEFVIDLNEKYGSGTLVGSVRILTERPAFALRGGATSKTIAKVLEVGVGENTYSIEVVVAEEGSLSFDIAGVINVVKTPLEVSLFSEAGNELRSTRTDELGNTHFGVPPLRDEFIVIKLNLQGNVREALLRIRKGKKLI